MTAPGWRTSLVVHGVTRAGRRVPVEVGLVEGANGVVVVALRVDGGEPIILPLQVAAQHIVNVREILLERLQVTGENIGGEAS